MNEKSITLVEACLAYVVLVSLIAVAALVSNSFHSLHVLISGAILFLLLASILKIRVVWRVEKVDTVILIILLAACFFRVNPYLWIVGGQDQGLYVNMSAHYERTGSPFIKDRVRSALDDSQKELYDKDNNHIEPGRMKPGQSEGWQMPGIFIKDLQRSENVFQFYPLHPLWMAIFGKVFGSENRVYSIVFFSLLSILFFYLITLEFTDGDKLPAYAIALFLALNPLHAFFGKFPVSETVSLFFSSAGFYYLIRYYKEVKRDRANPLYLVLSAGSISCLFFTHVSAFLYVPLVYILLLSTVIVVEKAEIRRHLFAYCLLIFLGFTLSLFYGYRFSFPYFYEVYHGSFEPYLGSHWDMVLILVVLVMGVLVGIAVRTRAAIRPLLSKIAPVFAGVLLLILFGSVFAGSYRAYQMGFTERYVGDSVLDTRFHLVHLGTYSLEFSPLFAVALYITPFGALLFPFALNSVRKRTDVMIVGLALFLSQSWGMRVGLETALPFQFYFSRYLFSEVIPYSLLLLVLFMNTLYVKGRVYKIIAIGAAILMSLYFVYFTSFQLFVSEAQGAHEALQRIARRMDEKSILIVNQHNSERYYPLITPLSCFYGLNTMGIDDVRITRWWYDLLLQYNAIFILSEEPLRRFDLVDIIDYKQGVFEQGPHIPRRFYYVGSTLYLYKVDHGSKVANLTKTLHPSLFEIEHFYGDNLWTNGDGLIKDVAYQVTPSDRYLTLVTRGFSPLKDDLEKLNLAIFVNGVELKFVRHSGVSYCFKLNTSVKEINEIRIRSMTFTPKTLGLNSDERQLGVDVASIKISDNC